jgi:hopene-associated glycosyltransferase HpnB
MILYALAMASVAIWLHLLFGRGLFWLARERDDAQIPPPPQRWPSVCAVVPARDEADVIGRSLSSLMQQDYPGRFRLVMVDDQSSDGTETIARKAAEAAGAAPRLTVLQGAPLPAGWTGKLWAVSQGVAHAAAAAEPFDYLLLTDADIAHAPDTLSSLVARAEASGLVLTSLMAKLHCATLAERALIPAFVFFFDMLYPFGQVNDPRRRMAAAAGGCMLIKRAALEAEGGINAIRAAIIDDCAMGALLKPAGPIWLGLTNKARSLRPYVSFEEIARMVSRSAYAQLRYSPVLLLGTLLGLAMTFLCPPALSLFGEGWPRLAGLLSWAMMAASFQPMLRFYGRSPLWGLALPLIAALYAGFTLRSALEVWRGRGGYWKGRAQAQAADI